MTMMRSQVMRNTPQRAQSAVTSYAAPGLYRPGGGSAQSGLPQAPARPAMQAQPRRRPDDPRKPVEMGAPGGLAGMNPTTQRAYGAGGTPVGSSDTRFFGGGQGDPTFWTDEDGNLRTKYLRPENFQLQRHGDLENIMGRRLAEAGQFDSRSLMSGLGTQYAATQGLGNLADQFGRMAAGETPGAAQLAFNQTAERARADAASMAASGQGLTPGQAARMSQRGLEDTLLGAQQQFGIQRANEQMSQLQAQQGALQSQFGLAGQLSQQELQSYMMDEAMRQQAEQGLISLAGAETQQAMALEQAAAAQRGIDLQLQAANAQAGAGLWGGIAQGAGGLLGGMGSILAMSDQNAKQGIGPAKAGIDNMLRALAPYEYEYKDPSMGAGRRVSVMAQDLEKTPMGAEFVVESPAGKMVDYGKGLGTMLAAQARLAERLDKLEGKRT